MPPAGRKSFHLEIAAVRRALSALDKALTRLAAKAKTVGQHAVMSPERSPRKLKLSPRRLKALQLHGRYMGYVRQLKPKAKAQVRALRIRKGVKAAIAKARKLAAA